MKNSKNKLVIALFAAMALLPACTKQGQWMGTLSLQLKAQEDLIDVSTKSNVSDYTALPEASAFSLSVVDSNDDITPVSAGVPVSLPEEIMVEVMQMTDAQKAEVLDFARALRRKEDSDITALMESIVAENEVAFKELAK